MTGVKSHEIARRAADLMSGDRAATHGDKMVNHQNIADLWNGYLGAQLARPVTPSQVALMMALLKIARTKAGGHNPDDYVDGTAYVAIGGELAEREQLRKAA